MENVKNIAQYICDEYKRVSGEDIDEMKLHKLLYLSQRESLAITNMPLFESDFEGWRYGPVCREIRDSFIHNKIDGAHSEINDESKFILKSIVLQYGVYDSWKLSEISHNEISWKNARKGLSSDENGIQILDINDIREDAKKIRPYDSVWDMYYDEFEDAKL